MQHKRLKYYIANIFGALGYFFCLLQWSWLMIVFLPLIMTSVERLNSLTSTPPSTSPPTLPLEPNLLTMAFAMVCIAIIMTLSIYIIFKIPFTIVNEGRRLTHEPAKKITFLIVKHTHSKVTKKERRQWTTRIVWTIKAIAIVLPFVLLFIAPHTHPAVSTQVTQIVGMIACLMTTSFFSLQFSIAFILRVPRDDLW